MTATQTIQTKSDCTQAIYEMMKKLRSTIEDGLRNPEDEAEKNRALAKITAKLESGKKLTKRELELLARYSPELYQQAMRVQSVRESIENSLKHARSKEEAGNIESTALAGISDNDPAKKYLMAALTDAIKEFRNSDAFASLPKTTEEAKEQPNRAERTGADGDHIETEPDSGYQVIFADTAFSARFDLAS